MDVSRDSDGNRAGVLACLSICMLLSALGTSIANVALPTFAEVFHGSFALVQWVVIAYLLGVTTLIVALGRLGDMIGRRRLLLAGIVLFTVASAFCGIVPTLPWLIAARATQAAGAAVMIAIGMAFAGDIFPKSRIGSALGWLAAMSATGTALGPTLGGILIGVLGWRSIFLVNVPLGLLALGLAYFHLPADRASANPARFDIAGAVLLASTLAAYALGVTVGGARLDSTSFVLLAVAALGGATFVLVEMNVRSPLVPMAMLRDPSLASGLITNAIVSTVMMSTLVVGPFYLSRALRLDTALTGLFMSVGPGVVALAGVPAGRISDRFGAHRVTIAGLLMMALGSLALFGLPTTLGVPGYIAPIVVITLGYAFFQTANNTAVMADLPPSARGVVSGMLNLARNLGLVTGASVMGAIFAAASGSGGSATAPPDAIAKGMQVTFGVAAVLIASGIAIGSAVHLLLRRHRVDLHDRREIAP